MVQMTMQVSEQLAKRIQPIGIWLPTIIEISLIGFKTLATIQLSACCICLTNCETLSHNIGG
jgi:hypothetical protein